MMNKSINLLVVLILVVISFSFAMVYQVREINAAGADDFVTTWQTDNPGTSDDNQITIPTAGGGAYNYDVDWGDGNVDLAVTGDITHTYAAPGQYEVRISGTFPRIYFNNSGDKDKIVSIDQWGTISWGTMLGSFYGCSNLNVLASDAPDLSGVLSMADMFRDATSLNADFNNWDTSNVTTMSGVFWGATSFNGDVSTWNTSSVTTMANMFREASSFNQSLNDWDVSGVVSVVNMFRDAIEFDQPLNGWETTSLKVISSVFLGASNFNQDLDNWDVSGVKAFTSVFQDASKFNGNVSTWDTSSATSMSSVFRRATVFDQPLNDWDVSGVTNFFSMFNEAEAFNQDLNNWTPLSVDTFSRMFLDAISFNGDVTTWDVSSATDFTSMFEGASSFDRDISEWDVSGGDNFINMFKNASIFNQDIGGWNMTNATVIFGMFLDAALFDQDISGWNVENVTNAGNMLLGSAFSTKNYDVLLIGWSEQNLQNGVTFAADANYCHGEEARDVLINDYSWSVSDGGLDCTDANKFPSAILVDGLETGEVLENQPVPASVGLLTVVDEDELDSHELEYGCTVPAADDDLFTLDGSNTLWTAQELNFEEPNDADQDNVYEICVKATDDGKPNLTAEVTLYVTVTNVNEAPIDLRIGNDYSVSGNERRKAGSTYGTFNTDDNGEENPDGFDYSFTCTEKGVDDKIFTISGSNLRNVNELYFSNPQDANQDNIYEICVVTTDNGGLSYEQDLQVEILNIGTQSGSSSSSSTSSGGEEFIQDETIDPVESEETNTESDLTTVEEEEEPNDFYSQLLEDEEPETAVEDSTSTESNTSSSSGGGSGGSYDPISFDLSTVNVTRGEFLKLILDVYMDKTDSELKKVGSEPFPDVDASYENYWYVVQGYEMGVILGDEGYAYVNRELKRVEALAMVLRLLEIDYKSYEYMGDYGDVDPGKWYAPVIEAAQEVGLAMWGGGDNFRPSMSLVDTEVEQLLEETMSRLR